LDQSHSVTVPFTVSVLSVSNTEVPWCANKGIDTIRRPTAKANTEIALFVIVIASLQGISDLEPTCPKVVEEEHIPTLKRTSKN